MRVFFKDSSVKELTNLVNRYKSGTYDLTMSSTNYIYIATDFPLNHLFVKLGTVVNLVPSTMSVSYWSGKTWTPVVHLNDYTNGFSNSGFVEFTPNRNSNWNLDTTSGNGNQVTGLESITVYDQYWTRISFSVSLTPAVDVEYIGNVFSDDDDLYAEFPLFNDSNFLTCFEAGKTTWEEQHVKAAELIIQDLVRKNIIIGAEQLLDRNILRPAAVSKVAEIIFNAFGKDYVDQLNRSKNEFINRMDLSKYIVDINNNAIKDTKENAANQGWLTR